MGGVYFTHQRSETDAIFSSLDEVFEIARRANISTTTWHLKTAYRENFGKMPEVLRRIQNARAQGIDVGPAFIPIRAAATDWFLLSLGGFPKAESNR
jgi:N-acyl-D-amino-acid deacylase